MRSVCNGRDCCNIERNGRTDYHAQSPGIVSRANFRHPSGVGKPFREIGVWLSLKSLESRTSLFPTPTQPTTSQPLPHHNNLPSRMPRKLRSIHRLHRRDSVREPSLVRYTQRILEHPDPFRQPADKEVCRGIFDRLVIAQAPLPTIARELLHWLKASATHILDVDILHVAIAPDFYADNNDITNMKLDTRSQRLQHLATIGIPLEEHPLANAQR